MNKFSSLLLTGLAFNAFTFNVLADGISLYNKTATPLYMAVKKSPLDGYSANSQIGWISNGKTGVMRSNDTYLANMGIAPNDSYVLGFFNANIGTYADCGEVISGTDRSFKYENGHCAEISQEAIIASSVFNTGVMGCSGIDISGKLQINSYDKNKNLPTPDRHPPPLLLRSLHPTADISVNGDIFIQGDIKSGGDVKLTGGATVFDNIYRYFTDNLTKQNCDLLKLDKYLGQYRVSQDKIHLVTDKKMLDRLSYTATEFFSASLKEKEITPIGETVEMYKVNNLDINGFLQFKEGNFHIHVAKDLTLGELGSINVSKNASLTLFVEGNINLRGELISSQELINNRPNLSLYTGGKSVELNNIKNGFRGVIYAPNAHLNINFSKYSLFMAGAIHADYLTLHTPTFHAGFINYITALSELYKVNK